MNNNRKATRATPIIVIIFIVLLIGDCILAVHCRESQNALIVLIFWGLFTLFFGYGIVYNLHKNSKLKKVVKLREQGMLQPINAKIIRFDFEISSGITGKGCFFIVASNGQTEFSSESIKGKVVGYDPVKLSILRTIGINYNILNIEGTIQRLEQIQTSDDVKRCIENNSSILGGSFNILHSMAGGGLYENLLRQVNECKEYLKEISKTTEFKNSYLQHKSHQIHVGDNITVYIDPNDSTIYHVNTDFLYN